MRVTNVVGMIAALGAVLAVSATVPAQRATPAPGTASPASPASAADATARIVAAAQKFLATLDDAGRAKMQFPFDSPQRSRWSNLPIGIYAAERRAARRSHAAAARRGHGAARGGVQ